MNKMRKVFKEMMEKGEKILVCYFPLCDPLLDDQVQWAKNYFDAGVTVLEMGLPYENPVLDGKTVRDSMHRALEKHTLDDAFEVIGQINKECPDKVLEIMTYYENIEKIGLEEFARKSREVGVDSILAPNMPLEKMAEADKVFGKYDIINLRFAYYNITDEQLEDLKQNADGFIFAQAVDGATGPQKTVDKQVGLNTKLLKDNGITTPVIGGFGISNAEQVYEMKSMGTDGCVIGSSVINAIANGEGKQFLKSLREALDRE
ncbi:MAG: tryptophan synthase subunit alpha [Erysipelotrichaceae bacterium]|jgi:tryptophan synthase alpha chain